MIVQGTFDANLKNRVQWWAYKASVGFTLPGLAERVPERWEGWIMRRYMGPFNAGW